MHHVCVRHVPWASVTHACAMGSWAVRAWRQRMWAVEWSLCKGHRTASSFPLRSSSSSAASGGAMRSSIRSHCPDDEPTHHSTFWMCESASRTNALCRGDETTFVREQARELLVSRV